MSAGVAAFIAHGAFWLLLVYGWFWDELGTWGAGILLAAWTIGAVVLPYTPVAPFFPFFSYVALLDVILVFVIFKGDVRLS